MFPALALSPDGRLLAAGAWRGIKIWEVETGHERRAFNDYQGDTLSLAFTPDGRALAAGNGDNTILIWSIPGTAHAFDGPLPDDPRVLTGLVNDLATDGAKAHRAIWGLVARSKAAIAPLRTLFKSGPSSANPDIPRLIKDLDSVSFAEREQASQALHNLGEQAEPALKKAAAGLRPLKSPNGPKNCLPS